MLEFGGLTIHQLKKQASPNSYKNLAHRRGFVIPLPNEMHLISTSLTMERQEE
jgi:hypothetical protein